MTDTALLLKNLRYLLALLKVPITQQSLRETLLKHPDYPSMEAVSDTLREYNLETLSVRLEEEHLAEIPYPALCHSNAGGGRFLILEKYEAGTITYFDASWGRKQKPVGVFASEAQWSGAVMLIHTSERSGEADYQKKRTAEKLRITSNYTAYLLAGLLLLLPVFKLPLAYLPIYALQLAGGFFSFVLLQRQFGAATTLTQAFCKAGGKSDCDAVIHSPASRLFGFIHLSELGIWYFVGNLILLLLASFAVLPVFGTLLVITLLALPFSLFSVYYQWRVLKKWCPLCLAVMGVFWLQVAAILPFSTHFSFLWDAVLFSFTLPLMAGIAVRHRLLDSFKIPQLEKKLNRFMRSERIFESLMQGQPIIEVGRLKREFSFGAENGLVHMVIVSNPLCSPCSLAHTVADQLIRQYGEQLTLTYRFLVNLQNKAGNDVEVARHLAALHLCAPKETVSNALSAWFEGARTQSVEAWKANYPLSREVNMVEVDDMLREQDAWCRQTRVNVTPTILINGKRLPEEYSLTDLKYHIGQLLERRMEDAEVAPAE